MKCCEEAGHADATDTARFVERVYEKLDETVGLEFIDSEGIGLYVCQSLLNHSCAPNAEVRLKLVCIVWMMYN